jgi:CMP-N-acetylneuraminic acid synthetase
MSALATIGIKGKDGKYKNYTVSISDFTDDYGQNVSMYDEQSKEEREQKVPKKYVGNGKVYWTDGKISLPEKRKQSESTQKVDEDLPF